MADNDGKDIAVLQVEMKVMKQDVSKLQTDVAAIKDDTGKILERILTLPQQYVTLVIFEQYKQEMQHSLRDARRRSWVQNVITAALGIIFGAIVTAAALALIQGRIH